MRYGYVDYALAVANAASAVDVAAIERVKDLLDAARAEDRMVYTAGNGGAATVAEHLALGLSLNGLRETGGCMRTVALHAAGASLAGAANDFGYDGMFSSQVRAMGRRGDALVLISGSGHSGNLVAAAMAARGIGMRVASIVGMAGPVSLASDAAVVIGTESHAVAEDAAIIVVHWLYGTYMPGGRPA